MMKNVNFACNIKVRSNSINSRVETEINLEGKKSNFWLSCSSWVSFVFLNRNLLEKKLSQWKTGKWIRGKICSLLRTWKKGRVEELIPRMLWQHKFKAKISIKNYHEFYLTFWIFHTWSIFQPYYFWKPVEPKMTIPRLTFNFKKNNIIKKCLSPWKFKNLFSNPSPNFSFRNSPLLKTPIFDTSLIQPLNIFALFLSKSLFKLNAKEKANILVKITSKSILIRFYQLMMKQIQKGGFIVVRANKWDHFRKFSIH